MSNIPSIPRSIHFFYINGTYGNSNLTFDTLKNIFKFVESIRTTNVKDLYYGDPSKEGVELFLALSRISSDDILGKIGYARKTDFPETLDLQGNTDILSLPNNRFLYEPTHFIIHKSYNNIPVLIYEFNAFGPRPQKVVSYYIRKLAVKLCESEGKPNCESTKIILNRLYRPNVIELLKNFDIIRSIEIKIEVSKTRDIIDNIRKSNAFIDLIIADIKRLPSGSKMYELKISVGRGRNEELDITISDIIDVFNELYPALEKFLLRTKKRGGKTVPIDLVRDSIIVRKYIKRSVKEGIISKSTDTEDAFRVLSESYEELKDVIYSSLMKVFS